MSLGIFNSSMVGNGLAALSFDQLITRMMPNGTAPLFGLTSMLKSETAVQIEHGYYAKTMLFPSVQANGVQTNAATTLTVDSTNNIIPGMQLRAANANGEVILVTAVLSETQLTVQRAFGGTAAAVTDDLVFYQIGNAHEEASIRPVPMSMDPERFSNITQIFRNTWAVSDTARATSVIAGGSIDAENRQDCASLHAKDIESALFFSKKFQGQRNGQPIRAMDGLISIISNLAYYPAYYTQPNVFTAGATTNYTQLETMLDPVFDQATDPKVANERVLFVGSRARKVLNNIGRLNGTYQITDGQTSYGLQFSTFKITRGTFRMIEHPLFNSNPYWSSMAVAVDLSTFSLAYLAGRKTQSKEFNSNGNVANDFGIDAVGGTLTTEVTCLVKNPPANAVINGLTAGAEG